MFLPAGHTIVGKIHKHAHLNIVSKGSVILSTEEGSKELNAPCVFTSYAGTKRAVYIKEDAIWITIHVTDKTDLKEIEAELIAASFGDLLEKNIGEHS
jgi:quercetin dioxygenase-like cupin family protein